jgi:hypothetical protein
MIAIKRSFTFFASASIGEEKDSVRGTKLSRFRSKSPETEGRKLRTEMKLFGSFDFLMAEAK